MPCYTVNTISVEFKAENIGILATAAKAIGATIQETNGRVFVRTKDGVMELRDGQMTGTAAVVNAWVNPLRVAYSKAVVREATRRIGWQVSQASETVFNVRKS